MPREKSFLEKMQEEIDAAVQKTAEQSLPPSATDPVAATRALTDMQLKYKESTAGQG